MLWWFAETTLIAGILALVAMLVPRLGRLGPAARHMLWLLVIVKLMTPPLIQASWPFGSWRSLAGDDGAVVVAIDPVAEARPEVEAETQVVANVEAVVPVEPSEGFEVAEDAEVAATTQVASEVELVARPVATPPAWAALSREEALLGLWILGSTTWGLVQAVRILRFRRRLRWVKPAPEWLREEAEAIGSDFGVRVPEMVVVPNLDVPSLWCLGRPKLMLPQRLVATEGIERWRGILAHELAHLRRGDHWIARLELLAGLIWWWNPLFWFARHRLDNEAELACDAWVVAMLPEDRFRYAETLLEVCASLSNRTPAPLPTLGIGGAGRLFERRLSMILHDKVPCRLSLSSVLGVGILGLFAAPTWVAADPPEPVEVKVEAKVEAKSAEEVKVEAKDAKSEAVEEVEVVVIDGNDDGDDEPKARVTRKPKIAKDAKGGKDGKARIGVDVDLSGLDELLGPNSEFSKSLEKMMGEIEKQLGSNSEFEKSVKEMGEKLGQEMKEKFGPGSDFEKQVREKLGPGSDFEKQLKGQLGDQFEFRFNIHKHSDKSPDGNLDAKRREEARILRDKARALADKSRAEADEFRKLQNEKMKALQNELKKQKAEAEAKLKEAKSQALLAQDKEAKAKLEKEKSEKLKAEKEKAKVVKDKKAKDNTKAKGKKDARIKSLESKLNDLLKELKELQDEDEDNTEAEAPESV